MAELVLNAPLIVSVLCSYRVPCFVCSRSLFKNALRLLLSLHDKSLTLSEPSPQKVLLGACRLGPGFPTLVFGEPWGHSGVDESQR